MHLITSVSDNSLLSSDMSANLKGKMWSIHGGIRCSCFAGMLDQVSGDVGLDCDEHANLTVSLFFSSLFVKILFNRRGSICFGGCGEGLRADDGAYFSV